MGLLSSLHKLLGRTPELSGAAAKDRLRVVLINDRSNIPKTMMDAIRAEMIEVLTKYVEIDQDALDVQLEKDQGAIGLVLNIPIRRVKSEQEVAEAVEEAQRIQAQRTQLQTEAAVPPDSDTPALTQEVAKETAAELTDVPANDPEGQTLTASVPALAETANAGEAEPTSETASSDATPDKDSAPVAATGASSEAVADPET